MEEGRRSVGDQSGILVKNRSSSGCLIVKKKTGDGGISIGSGVGSSPRTQKSVVFKSKKEKKRSRLVMSDSGSSDELLMPPRRRVGPETVRVCNGLNVYEKGVVEDSEFGRKRIKEEYVGGNEGGFVGRNGEVVSERKRDRDRDRDRLEVFEFDEYDDGEMMRRARFKDCGMKMGGRRFFESMPVGRSGMGTEYEGGSSIHAEKRTKMYFDRGGGFDRGDYVGNRFDLNKNGARMPISLLREKFMGDSDEPIRLQGKNGVLKVMVNKKKKMGDGPLKSSDNLEAEENRRGSRTEDTIKRNVLERPSFYSDTKVTEKQGSISRTEKNQVNLQKSLSVKNDKGIDWELEDSDTSLKLSQEKVEAHDSVKRLLTTKKSKSCNRDSKDSDTLLKLGPKNAEARNSEKRVSCGVDTTPTEKLTSTKIKDGKVKRGSGTEKQKLRERIRAMLLSAGWTIDYRPRKNRDYLDAVYINRAGTAFWSIIKAYDALQKQLADKKEEIKPSGEGCAFTPLPDELLSQLTRNTRKKMEKEMKRKQKGGSGSKNAKEAAARKSSNTRHDEESSDNDSHEEKLSSYIKQGGKSFKGRVIETVSVNSKNQSYANRLHGSDEKPSSASNSHTVQGRKSRKLGRCTLLVRSSNDGLNSETDGFVPYAGKRTLLSWLIDSGTVQLSEKVQYMNRRRTRVMLEGWITRDGIHCGCCSKILTVLKFEIHAGSKLRQPFQNIYLDSGLSLLQCQVDTWNRQEESERIGFHPVDTDGDDPNDDTCGICGDGGDLICCDGCPSTYHQSCLDISMLPTGDWQCPNCTCKFCGVAGGSVAQGDVATDCALFSCNLCEKKYHKSCMQEMDALSIDLSCSVPSFCGQKCSELFEHLQRDLGVKHELEAGFSWSLIRRTDADSDTPYRGLPQRVECNSKLAVALTVMDECFLPIIDRRSEINLIKNVLYNCGSNFNRLNYGGFYTAILERGDEIISAASIRFHGTELAEMPFIGTRDIYRRQGMCRRLFCAIELALCALKIEKLVIPAVSELMHTWTEVFGFTPLEESLKKQMRSMNMLVFPGVDMLQKLLLEQESIESISKGAKEMVLQSKNCITPMVANKSNVDSCAGNDTYECDDGKLCATNKINGEAAAVVSDFQYQGVSLDSTLMSGSIDTSQEQKIPVSAEGTSCADSQSGNKLAEPASDRKFYPMIDTSHNSVEVKKEPLSNSYVEDNGESRKEDVMNNYHIADTHVAASVKIEIAVSVEGTVCTDYQTKDKLDESASESKFLVNSNAIHNAKDMENKLLLGSNVKDKASSCKEGDMDDNHVVDINVTASSEDDIPVSAEENVRADSQSRDRLVESTPDRKYVINSDTNHGTLKMEDKLVLDSPVKDDTWPCRKVEMDDAHAIDVDVSASNENEFPFSIGGGTCADSQSGDKFPSDGKCLSISDTSHGTLETENKPLLDSTGEDDTLSCKAGDRGFGQAIDVNVAALDAVDCPISVQGAICADSQSKVKLAECALDGKCCSPAENDTQPFEEADMRENFACLKNGISQDNTMNTTEDLNVIPDVTVSTFNGSEASSLQIKSDSNNEVSCAKESKLDVASESASGGM
ncbi:PHD domain-containing protein [Cephalotus follicularis]|uniref:PHD domain-containing protein n=1 Tax=Cephalotus follicularis TaxID=3775 RepID=A0A1Q3CXQ0_CEPFO|nr:PHD domain-containing protein [Cephalotus follicularis]